MTDGAARGERRGAQIGPGTIVAVSYELYDGEGELLEASDPALPWTFVFGYGQAPPSLEQALGGLVAGQARRVRLTPAEAFGARDPGALIEVDRDELPAGTVVGDFIDAETEDGEVAVPLRVLDLSDDVAVLDANHPLAGQPVDVDVVVESVRIASSAELHDAEAALHREDIQGMRTLIPARRLLKRAVGGKTPRTPGDD